MADWSPEEIEPLVERLSSVDAFERLTAMQQLYERTRATLGFRFNDPPADREAAVKRWKELLDTRKREEERTKKLKAAIEFSGAKIDVETLREAIDAIPPEKIQGYLGALILKMKAQQLRCEQCESRPAAVRITEISNGKAQTRHLCEICARERGDLFV